MWLETKPKLYAYMLAKVESQVSRCVEVLVIKFVEIVCGNGHECDFISYWDKLCQQDTQHHYVWIKNLPIASNLLRLLFDFIILTDPVYVAHKRLAQARLAIILFRIAVTISLIWFVICMWQMTFWKFHTVSNWTRCTMVQMVWCIVF